MKTVIEDEHTRPLDVTRDFVNQYDAREKESSERLSRQVDKHITTLSSLKKNLEKKVDLKTRTQEYRDWKR